MCTIYRNWEVLQNDFFQYNSKRKKGIVLLFLSNIYCSIRHYFTTIFMIFATLFINITYFLLKITQV